MSDFKVTKLASHLEKEHRKKEKENLKTSQMKIASVKQPKLEYFSLM